VAGRHGKLAALSQFPELGAAAPAAPPTQISAVPSGTAVIKTEPLAIWSLVLSLLGLFCCGFVLGIGGVVCGHLALSKIQKEPQLQGKDLATAGLIIGYLAIVFWVIYLVFFGGLSFLQTITHGHS
jgi:Domain of unknown function (DUF4190)